MQGLCAEKNTIGLRKRLIAALYFTVDRRPRMVLKARRERRFERRPQNSGLLLFRPSRPPPG